MRQTCGLSHRSSAKPIPLKRTKLAALFPEQQACLNLDYRTITGAKRKSPDEVLETPRGFSGNIFVFARTVSRTELYE